MKAYSNYYDSNIECIKNVPSHWKRSKVKHIADYLNGLAFKPTDWTDNGKKIIRIQNLTNSEAIFNYSLANHDEIYLIKKDDILISWSASLGVFVWNDEPAWLNQHIFKASPNQKIVRKKYFVWLAKWFIGEMSKDAHGSTMQHLTKDNFGSFVVYIPPLPEQQAIADFLDQKTAQIDTLIEKKHRQIDLLQEQRTALINHAVTKGLNPDVHMKDSGVEWLGEIPSHWEIIRLKHLLREGLRNGIFKKNDDFGSGTKLVNVKDLYQDTYLVNYESLDRVQTNDNELSIFGVSPGDVFFVRSSLKLEGVGVSVCLSETPEPTVFECHVVKGSPKKEKIEPLFLIHYLNSYKTRHKLIASAETVTMTTLRQSKISSLEIAVPPLDEQTKIIKYLLETNNKIYKEIDQIKLQISYLQEYRTALIFEAVTGKIDVRTAV